MKSNKNPKGIFFFDILDPAPLNASVESSWGRLMGGVLVFIDLSSPHGEAPSVSKSRLAKVGDAPVLIAERVLTRRSGLGRLTLI